jgi:hypothetical protein
VSPALLYSTWLTLVAGGKLCAKTLVPVVLFPSGWHQACVCPSPLPPPPLQPPQAPAAEHSRNDPTRPQHAAPGPALRGGAAQTRWGG